MKFTRSWLLEHLDTDADIAAIEQAMTMAGLEVEEIENPAEKLAAFTIAHVKTAEKHPDADKLKVCQVETVDGLKQIVCGAPNARAGMAVAYAPLGAYIPGLDFSLDKKPRKIRGVESSGMMCSSKELECGDDHDGIMDLSTDIPVGTPLADALELNDPVVDFEVTPNRPDWLGVDGIARDLAAAGLGRLKTKMPEAVNGAFECPVKIEIDDSTACPVFAGRVVRGVKNGPSPDWLQARLRAIGLRPINALVDITNLLSYDRARPLHVYDVSKLSGPVRARMGDGTESFEALDGKDYTPTPAMCVIADDARVLGLGGVMGGAYSGCTDDTTDVFIESAYFDPMITRATGRETGIQSDAKYRFERGVDTGFVVPGLEMATQLVLELCGGKASKIEVAGDIPAVPAPVEFDPAENKRLTGLDVPADEIARILETLGFGVERAKTPWTITVPSWRRDVTMQADLVEEIARIHGFDKLEATPLPRSYRREPLLTSNQNRARLARRALAGRGLQEAVTWSFVPQGYAQMFGGGGDGLVLSNPIASELNCMRPTALIHLLLAGQRAADKGYAGAALFEVGPIYLDDTDKGQRTSVAGMRRVESDRHWQGADAPDVYDIKADLLAALDAAGAPVSSFQVQSPASTHFHPGRSARLQLGPKNVIAEFGEIHPQVLADMGIEGRVVAFESFIENIPPARKKAGKTKGELLLSELMPVRRDFAFVVEDAVAADTLIRAAKGADKKLISDVSVFDVYQGQGIDDGHKSVALEVTLTPTDATLTDEQIDGVSKQIIAKVEKASGGKLRA